MNVESVASVESFGVSTLQVLIALPCAILLLLGALSLTSSAAARGFSSHPDSPPPLAPLTLLISPREARPHPSAGRSAPILSRAPPGCPPRPCPSPAAPQGHPTG